MAAVRKTTYLYWPNSICMPEQLKCVHLVCSLLFYRLFLVILDRIKIFEIKLQAIACRINIAITAMYCRGGKELQSLAYTS